MNLHPAATEYVHIPITGAPEDANPMEVSFDGGTTWHPTTWSSDRKQISVLVSGPQGTGGGVALPSGRHSVTVRLTDTPERIVRSAGGRIEIPPYS